MILAGFILIFLYSLVMLYLMYGYVKTPYFSTEAIPESTSQKTTFSILIPFRNEAENLPRLLTSLQKLNYPHHLFEIILINDVSEDSSEKIILDFKHSENAQNIDIKLLQNQRISASPKKDALTQGIKHALNTWILTTDADCEAPSTWLQAFDSFIQKHDVPFIVAPITTTTNTSFAQQFQYFDTLSLQFITIGTFGIGHPLLCNGANLAYKKNLFKEVNGFKGNDHLASGDDIFMWEKAKRATPTKPKFIKSKGAIVKTQPQNTWSNLVQQRIRWASKTSKQKDSTSKLLGALVFCTNLWIIIAAIVAIFQTDFLSFLGFFLVLKLIVDGIALLLSIRFSEGTFHLFYFMLSFISYPFITVFVVLKSLTGSYTWKGRNYRMPFK